MAQLAAFNCSIAQLACALTHNGVLVAAGGRSSDLRSSYRTPQYAQLCTSGAACPRRKRNCCSSPPGLAPSSSSTVMFAGVHAHLEGALRPVRQRAPRRMMAASALKAAPNASNTPRKENVAGDFFVDATCIDCDTCRWMAPETFSSINGQSAVHEQPTDKHGRVRAMQALLSCPTNSIHASNRDAAELREAQQGLPAPLPGCPGVYHTGWHTVKSYAGTPYLLVREAGNIMIDSPRYNPVLARRLEELGGVKYMFLTHKDDIGDHEKWQAHFNCQRVIHELELGSRIPHTEVKLSGEGPWTLDSEDIELVFTPGHTRGHVCLFHKPSKALFTGDHLARAEEQDRLYVYKDFNWYSFQEQLRSVHKLLQYDFLHVLPSHGRMMHLRDATHRLQQVHDLLQLHGFGQPAPV